MTSPVGDALALLIPLVEVVIGYFAIFMVIAGHLACDFNDPTSLVIP